MTPCDVLGVGANSVDYVNRIPSYPSPNGSFSKMRIQEQAICCGGQTATALSTCVSLGLTARYVGATGTDENGKRIRSEMSSRGIDLSEAVIRDGPNQFALIIVDEQTGERIVLWDRDERLKLRARELPPEVIGSGRLVHVDDVDESAAIVAANLGRELGRPVTSDIDRLSPRTMELVEALSYPIFAEHVPRELTGIADPGAALRRLHRPGHAALVVTLGSRGCVGLVDDRVIHSPGFPVRSVDTTGAGDVFRGAFIYGVLAGWPLERTLRFANAAAAISCTRLGAMNGVPAFDEVTRLAESVPA
ncbi:MAG TPA: PfkB family carbohydrate kinase [Vicinamibacterales bacterium]|nr:PfkB family carbohydrate kinase [Vicinamibacterales bacterium]